MSVDYHRHCQATVLGATGDPHGNGSTWSTIRDLSPSIPNIVNRVPTWRDYFTNNNNITDDLAGILKLIDAMAVGGGGGSGDCKRYWLQFTTNNGSPIDSKEINPNSSLPQFKFENFGRNLKIKVKTSDGDQFVKFHTVVEGDYHNEGGQRDGENLEVTIPNQKPTEGDLIKIGADGREVSVKNNISPGYTGPVGIDASKRQLIEYPITHPPPHLTQQMFDQIFPTGTVYITMTGAPPFQNIPQVRSTWEQIGQGMCLWGCESDIEIGEERGAGLPNIKGYFGAKDVVSKRYPNDPVEVFTPLDAVDMPNNSPIYPKWNSRGPESPDKDGDSLKKATKKGGVVATDGAGYYGIGFNAQRHNSIYGNSDTVQPPALVVKFWKRVDDTST